MEIELNPGSSGALNQTFKSVDSEVPRSGTRAKSANRIRYEAETALLRRKIGDLESIRQKLGLSQRKICQLLFVDPSAWTRWTKRGDNAPPHIYRALQWYLALEEKYPALDVNFWLGTAGRSDQTQISGVQDDLRSLKTKIGELEFEKSRVSAIQFSETRQSHEIATLKRNLGLLLILNSVFSFALLGVLGWVLFFN